MSQGLTVYFMHCSIFITVTCDIGDISLYILITMFSFPLSLYSELASVQDFVCEAYIKDCRRISKWLMDAIKCKTDCEKCGKLKGDHFDLPFFV